MREWTGGGGTGIEGAGSGGEGVGSGGRGGGKRGKRGDRGREVCNDMGKKLLLFDKKVIENCPNYTMKAL